MLMDAQAVALRKVFRFDMNVPRINIWTTRTHGEFVDLAYKELRVRVGSQTGGFWTTARGGTICLPYVKAGNLHPGSVMMHEATHQFLHAALDPDDAMGGTRLKGEPPYEPEAKEPDDAGKGTVDLDDLPPEIAKLIREGKPIPPELLEKLHEHLQGLK
jgi:hypothetical protein